MTAYSLDQLLGKESRGTVHAARRSPSPGGCGAHGRRSRGGARKMKPAAPRPLGRAPQRSGRNHRVSPRAIRRAEGRAQASLPCRPWSAPRQASPRWWRTLTLTLTLTLTRASWARRAAPCSREFGAPWPARSEAAPAMRSGAARQTTSGAPPLKWARTEPRAPHATGARGWKMRKNRTNRRQYTRSRAGRARAPQSARRRACPPRCAWGSRRDARLRMRGRACLEM
jgi:hypothetical protein